MEHPPPLSPAYQPDTLFPWEVETPPPPGRSAASSRPLQRGRAVWGDWPDGRDRGRREDLRGVSRLKPAEVMLSPDTVSMGNRPRGGGARRGGGWNIPLLCLLCLWLNGIRRPPPPPGRSAASSRPLQRGRAVWGDWPDGRVRGRREDLRGVSRLKPAEVMLSPDTVSRGNHPRGGGADGEGDGASPPVSCVSG
jgi:hypothetical protein